jgi:hypothetical protein
VGDSRSRGRDRDPHRSQKLTGTQDGLVRADQEVGERHPPTVVLDFGIQGQEEVAGSEWGVRQSSVCFWTAPVRRS